MRTPCVIYEYAYKSVRSTSSIACNVHRSCCPAGAASLPSGGAMCKLHYRNFPSEGYKYFTIDRLKGETGKRAPTSPSEGRPRKIEENTARLPALR